MITFLSYVVLSKPYAVDVTLTSIQQKPERKQNKKQNKTKNSSIIRWNGHCNTAYAKVMKMKNVHRVTEPKNLNI